MTETTNDDWKDIRRFLPPSGKRLVLPGPSYLADSELPDELARTVGQRWLEEYGDYEDKAFVAVGVYRMMRLAMLEPDAPELERYR